MRSPKRNLSASIHNIISHMKTTNGNAHAAAIILRWGLAFIFFYAAISSLRSPDNWIGFLPHFVQVAFPGNLSLTVFAALEIILAAWLFSGRKLVWSAGLASLALLLVILANLDAMDLIFRDVGLLFAALALLELARNGAHTAETEE